MRKNSPQDTQRSLCRILFAPPGLCCVRNYPTAASTHRPTTSTYVTTHVQYVPRQEEMVLPKELHEHVGNRQVSARNLRLSPAYGAKLVTFVVTMHVYKLQVAGRRVVVDQLRSIVAVDAHMRTD